MNRQDINTYITTAIDTAAVPKSVISWICSPAPARPGQMREDAVPAVAAVSVLCGDVSCLKTFNPLAGTKGP